MDFQNDMEMPPNQEQLADRNNIPIIPKNRAPKTEAEYAREYITNNSKKFKMPNSIFIDAKLNPMKADHIIILSKNVFPQDCKTK